MNKIKISIFLFSIILGLCFFYSRIIKNITSTSANYVNQIEVQSKNGNIDESQKIYSELNDYWEKKSKILNTLVHHDIIDKISESISKLKVSVYNCELYDVSKVSEKIIILLDSVVEMDNLSLENLLWFFIFDDWVNFSVKE